MSDIENEYSASESESDSEIERQSNIRKKATTNKAKSAVLSDNEDDDNESDRGSESDADGSVAESKDDSDMEDMNPDEMDEDELFADVVKPSNKNGEIDEFQFGFDSDNEEEDDDSDLDEDEDKQYLQKLDDSVREQTIANHHPELIIHNYDEVDALTTIVRDERGVIIDPLHRTLPFLSKYERARILGERAKQINDGAKPFVTTDPSVIDGYLIALKELEEKKLPFIIRRPLNNGASEYWKLRDIEFL